MYKIRRSLRLLIVCIPVVTMTVTLLLFYWRNHAKAPRAISCDNKMQKQTKVFTWDALALNRSLQVIDASKFMRNTDTQRNRFEYLLKPIVEPVKCQEMGDRGWTSVAVLKSAVGNKDRRDAIRETWASVKRFNGSTFMTVFVVGIPQTNIVQQLTSIRTEYETHNDILLVDILDTGRNVPEKTLAGMQWADESLPSHWIYSSGDDDMSLHLRNFARYVDSIIKKFDSSNKINGLLPIMCVYSYRNRDPPVRDPKSKWYTPESEYAAKLWPPYCRGGWYSMTVELAGQLYQVSRWMTLLTMDDVWITGLMRVKYLSGMPGDTKSISHLLLDAAPLSERDSGELSANLKESTSVVIVSHAWGNIQGRNVDVAKKLRSNWEMWSMSLQLSET